MAIIDQTDGTTVWAGHVLFVYEEGGVTSDRIAKAVVWDDSTDRPRQIYVDTVARSGVISTNHRVVAIQDATHYVIDSYRNYIYMTSFNSLIDSEERKRQQLPVGLKVYSVAGGKHQSCYGKVGTIVFTKQEGFNERDGPISCVAYDMNNFVMTTSKAGKQYKRYPDSRWISRKHLRPAEDIDLEPILAECNQRADAALIAYGLL